MRELVACTPLIVGYPIHPPIGVDDNATFSEEDGFCVNEDEGCED